MNKILKIVFFYIFAICAISCNKDKGNYDYHDINEISLSGIKDAYEISAGDTIRIIPKFDFLLDSTQDSSKYSYQWISYALGVYGNDRKKILLTTRNMESSLPLSVGKYTIYYVIKEKSTGITWQKSFSLTISANYKGGWAILTDVNNKARVDYFQYNDSLDSYNTIYRDFTNLISDNTSKTLDLKGKGKFVQSVSNRITGIANNATKSFLYVGTDSLSEKINCTDGYIWANNYYFAYETMGGVPSNPDWVEPQSTGGLFYAYNDGDMYFKYVTSAIQIGTPINRLADGTPFEVEKYVAIPGGPYACILMFDKTHKRFVKQYSYNRYSILLPSSGGFDANNVGMDLVWMGWTSAFSGQAYAILKDVQDKRYIARMGFTNSSSATYSSISLEEITTSATDISKATAYTIDQQNGYLFYAVGGKLYQYNVNTKVCQLAYDYGTSTITLLKVNKSTRISMTLVINNPTLYAKRFSSIVFGIVVGSYNSSAPDNSGRVDVFKVPELMGAISPYYTLAGMGKVVDAAYNEL